MKFNTKIIKKIAMLLVIVTICNFIIPNTVAVAASTSWLAKAGGNLLSVILDFFVFIGDGIMNVLQNNFISSQKVIEEAYSGELADAGNVSPGDMLKIILGVLTVVVAVCVAVASFGTLSWASVGAVVGSLKLIGGVVLFSTVGTLAIVSGTKGAISGFKGEFDLPMIRYTPYEIFSNQIPLLDVNFIKPMDSIVEEVTGGPVIKVHLDDGWAWSHGKLTAEEVAISCTSGGGEKKWNKRVHEEVDYQYSSDNNKGEGKWTKDDTTILEWWIEENKKYYRLTFENKNDVDNNTSYMWHLDEYTIPDETAEPKLGIKETYTFTWKDIPPEGGEVWFNTSVEIIGKENGEVELTWHMIEAEWTKENNKKTTGLLGRPWRPNGSDVNPIEYESLNLAHDDVKKYASLERRTLR